MTYSDSSVKTQERAHERAVMQIVLHGTYRIQNRACVLRGSGFALDSIGGSPRSPGSAASWISIGSAVPWGGWRDVVIAGTPHATVVRPPEAGTRY